VGLWGRPDLTEHYYPPLSGSQFLQGRGMDLWIMGSAFVGVASIAGALNLVVTIFNSRVPGMTMFRLPLFTWGVLVTLLLILFAFPPLTAAATAESAARCLARVRQVDLE
jgi:cytochrome c oxidase subunit 1